MKATIWNRAKTYLAFAALTVLGLGAAAQDAGYPNKPIELVVPFGPGATSTGNFVLAKALTESLKQPIVILNKAGAGGAIGTAYAASAKPDGYTLLAAVPAFVTLPLTETKLPYKTDDFVPVGQFARFNHYLIVNKDSPAKNLKELFDDIKNRPRAVNYAGTGVGGTAYLLIETLKLDRKLAGPQFIPYPSESGALNAVIANDIQFAIVSSITAAAQMQQGTVRALAVFSSQRDPLLPQVPTAIEQNFPELLTTGYLSIVAPAKTPEPIVKALEAAIEKAVNDKQLQESLMKIGTTAYFRNSKDLGSLFASEQKTWSEMGKRAGVNK
jgi:tripartite-type tricarboxylate transporter receptor subunit TctC